MSRLMKAGKAGGRPQEQGFVLPYVLVVIAILSIAGTIAAQRLTRASEVVAQMQMKAESARYLHSAEAAATYSVLTGNALQGGYDLAPDSPIVMAFGVFSADGKKLLTRNDAKEAERDFWPADGTPRKYVPPANSTENPPTVFVRLQDSAGLLSLNHIEGDLLERALRAAGAPPRRTRAMVDSLRDYIDSDDRRQNKGAEANEYRRSKKAAPSNSPLRSLDEMGAIWGWDEDLAVMDIQFLKDMTTTSLTPGFREVFSTARQKEIFGLQSGRQLGERVLSFETLVGQGSASLSGKVRLTIFAPRLDGKWDTRAVEIERRLSGVGTPYRRRWVYENTVLGSTLDKNMGLSPERGEPLNLDGIKDVVHAASSAR